VSLVIDRACYEYIAMIMSLCCLYVLS
jgi:hypothetical protein